MAVCVTGGSGLMPLTTCIDCGMVMRQRRTRCKSCQRERDAARNSSPARVALYGGDWASESRTIRLNSPRCVVCGIGTDLTVDHPTRSVYCRSHHSEMEAERRNSQRNAEKFTNSAPPI